MKFSLILSLCASSSTWAFTTSPRATTNCKAAAVSIHCQSQSFLRMSSAVAGSDTSSSSSSVDSNEDEELWYKAVQFAAGESGHIDDLEPFKNLVQKLEDALGCEYETEGEETCLAEISDRQEVAQILRLKIELQERLDKLQAGNVFVQDVMKEHQDLERKRFKDALLRMQKDGDAGSDLGLW